MGRQRENGVRSSVNFAYTLIAVNMAAILTYIDNLILYGQISSYHFVSQPSDTTKNVANCIN